MFSIESPHRGNSNDYKQYTIFNIKRKIDLNYLKSAAMGFFFQGTQERVRNSRGKRVISFELLKFHGSFTQIHVYCKIQIQSMVVRMKKDEYHHIRLCYQWYEITC